jgi:outer membrane protein OmpA-like peptidoglycan-associated protein
MKRLILSAVLSALTIGTFACGGSRAHDATPAEPEASEPADDGDVSASEGRGGRGPSDSGEFAINDTGKASRPTQGQIRATDTEAAVRFFVVDKAKGPIKGIVVSLTDPSGKVYYTGETGSDGYAEVLVPIGRSYDLVYLSLGRRNVAAKVNVPNQPRQNLKLTMRYQREDIAVGDAPPRFVLDDVQFSSGKATLTPESSARLDTIVEYMTHRPSVRIEISGHTDDVGKKAVNQKLSQQRADAVRAYLVAAGIDESRVESIGLGDQRPLVPNDSPENRQKNRRIEAREL